jgi:hypothetical protein
MLTEPLLWRHITIDGHPGTPVYYWSDMLLGDARAREKIARWTYVLDVRALTGHGLSRLSILLFHARSLREFRAVNAAMSMAPAMLRGITAISWLTSGLETLKIVIRANASLLSINSFPNLRMLDLEVVDVGPSRSDRSLDITGWRLLHLQSLTLSLYDRSEEMVFVLAVLQQSDFPELKHIHFHMETLVTEQYPPLIAFMERHPRIMSCHLVTDVSAYEHIIPHISCHRLHLQAWNIEDGVLAGLLPSVYELSLEIGEQAIGLWSLLDALAVHPRWGINLRSIYVESFLDGLPLRWSDSPMDWLELPDDSDDVLPFRTALMEYAVRLKARGIEIRDEDGKPASLLLSA